MILIMNTILFMRSMIITNIMMMIRRLIHHFLDDSEYKYFLLSCIVLQPGGFQRQLHALIDAETIAV